MSDPRRYIPIGHHIRDWENRKVGKILDHEITKSSYGAQRYVKFLVKWKGYNIKTRVTSIEMGEHDDLSQEKIRAYLEKLQNRNLNRFEILLRADPSLANLLETYDSSSQSQGTSQKPSQAVSEEPPNELMLGLGNNDKSSSLDVELDEE